MRVSASSRHRAALAGLSVDRAAHSSGFRRSLPDGFLTALANLVRAMNCYYSNSIEGHETYPLDIGRVKAIVLGFESLSARDALHLAIMGRHGSDRILSFDGGFHNFPGITCLSAG